LPKLPTLTPKKVISLLEKNGFLLDHSSGSHYVFYHPIKKTRVVVPYHKKDLPKGTLVSILRHAEIDREDFSK
jgi:predicted RNA binding protein YcfA (HicA-like mRNA interferase family)